MIVSVNWLKKFTNIDVPIDELATLIGARLVEIEAMIDLGAKYQDVIVAKVIEAGSVPDSDHLNLCKIDDGGARKDVERDENGFIQVVCGAPNVRAGLLVAWLPPNTVVPETHGTAEPFVLGARKLRGFMSNGMIASARELDLWDEHDGILEIDREAKPGDSFAELYELDDYLLDIENKSLTHRPDCFGLVGLAREIAAIQGKTFTSPTWFKALDPILGDNVASLKAPTVKIADPAICKRYQGVVLADVDSSACSNILTSSYLSRSGMRPISAAVDITNWLMLVTGQPLHAFDYNKFCAVSSTREADIVVRTAKDGETLALLDGRTIELSTDDIVICAGNKPVALAGAMGGAETEIDVNTKNILLESATFDLYKLRNTQFRHGIFSEAITRFTKGQPAALTAPVLAKAVEMFIEQTNAKQATDVIDAYPEKTTPERFEINNMLFTDVLGKDYSPHDITETLSNLEYSNVTMNGGTIMATAAWWRTDLHIDEDVVEDIGRVNGYDNIKPTLPKRNFTAIRPSTMAQLQNQVRQILAAAGANEILSYNFIHGDLLAKVGQDPANSYRIINAISPDLQYSRQSLTPSLLAKTYMNSKVPYDNFALFEINKVHQKSYGLDEDGVPIERSKLALVVADRKRTDAAYYLAKAYIGELFARLELDVKFVPLVDDRASNKPFEVKRSAQIKLASDPSICFGVIGEFRHAVRRAMKLPEFVAGFELDLERILQQVSMTSPSYEPPVLGGQVERDITASVADTVTYQEVLNIIQDTLVEFDLKFTITPVSIYQSDDRTVKNLSFRLQFALLEKTLTGKEIAHIMNTISEAIVKDAKAKII